MGDNTHDTPDQIKPETIAANKASADGKARTPKDQGEAAVSPTTATPDRPHRAPTK